MVGKTAAKAAAKKATAKKATAKKATAKKPQAKKTAEKKTTAKKPAAKKATERKATLAPAKAPVLLSGGNPQIAKGYGEAPIQAYIAAMPGWKREVGARLDALISRAVPGVSKAVKWNSPMYGIEGQGMFLGIHCFAKYIKVAFFRGTALKPMPPGESKSQDTRYLDIREDDALDEARFVSWVKQASQLPGERM
jgi:hypothetical protein